MVGNVFFKKKLLQLVSYLVQIIGSRDGLLRSVDGESQKWKKGEALKKQLKPQLKSWKGVSLLLSMVCHKIWWPLPRMQCTMTELPILNVHNKLQQVKSKSHLGLSGLLKIAFVAPQCIQIISGILLRYLKLIYILWWGELHPESLARMLQS